MNPRQMLKKTAEEAREMHRLYPFLKTVSSAKRDALGGDGSPEPSVAGRRHQESSWWRLLPGEQE